MAAATAASRSALPPQLRAEVDGMNTRPDPRSPSPASLFSRGSSPGSVEHHPDLTNEVAALSTKLVNAINNQTALDDSLQETRHELQVARERLAQLERAAKEHAALISQGLLVKKEAVEKREAGFRTEMGTLREDLQRERQKREGAEKEKKRMESELETLTASLFEEANTMVAAARKETDTSKHRVEQLKTQLRDTETLLSSQQEQLQDLKAVMQQMSDRDEGEASTHLSSAPSTPGLSQGKMSRMFDSAHLTPVTPGTGSDADPQPPLFFHQLVNPVLRSDLPAYQDFQNLLRTAKDTATAQSTASSRNASGSNFSALNAMSIGLGSTSNLAHNHGLVKPNISTPPLTPNLAPSSTSASGTGSPRDSLSLSQQQQQQAALPPLKESKYFKRCLPEDVEPTLRLDLAPGLSWLNKRSILQGIVGGSLAIEPAPAPVGRFGPAAAACALCGEAGKREQYARKHQFRIAEDGSAANTESGSAASSSTGVDRSSNKAQRWPLCDWCLGRVRATCDFVGFLRMCQAGVWKADTPDRVRDAWEEGVRLRERMFWARVGGGVVPSFVLPSSLGDGGRASQERKRAGEEDPFKGSKEGSGEKRVSIGRTVIGRVDSAAGSSADEAQQQQRKTKTSPTTTSEKSRRLPPPPLPPRTASASTLPKRDSPPPTTVESAGAAAAEKVDAVVAADAVGLAPATAATAADATKPDDAKDKPAERLSVTIPGSFNS